MLAGLLAGAVSACRDDEPKEFGGGTTALSAPGEGARTAVLERLSLARRDGYDRVVWQFRRAIPGYRVEYVEPPLHEDGSGDEVDVEGDAFVLVTMQPASGFDVETGEGELVYRGPQRLSGSDVGASVVREVVRTGDFEAMLTWAVGLDSRVDFRVRTLDAPPRLVVEFAAR